MKATVHSLKIGLVAIGAVLIWACQAAEATIIYVSAGQSIQAAIEAATNGDEIVVAPGTYNEAINFLTRAVWLHSSGGPSVTTINGTGHYHVVQCILGEGPDTILEGFTIRGGNANGTTDPAKRGGGMYNASSCLLYTSDAADE